MRNKIRERLQTLIGENKITITQVSEIFEKEKLAESITNDVEDLIAKIENSRND